MDALTRLEMLNQYVLDFVLDSVSTLTSFD